MLGVIVLRKDGPRCICGVVCVVKECSLLSKMIMSD